MPFRFPDMTHRVTINGRTGSGKTYFAAWLLSNAPFDKIPYVVIDYKGDGLLNNIPRIKPLNYKDRLPKEKGVFILHPNYGEEDEMENWLRRCWERGKIGLYFDEGYMVPAKRAFNAILTQGRSKHIPAIIISQRPTRISRMVFSEADFYSLFHLNDKDDVKLVANRAPIGDPNHPAWDMETVLPKFHSRWYDQSEHYSTVIKPVPSADIIHGVFEERLKPKRKWM